MDEIFIITGDSAVLFFEQISPLLLMIAPLLILSLFLGWLHGAEEEEETQENKNWSVFKTDSDFEKIFSNKI